jgi:hypothetical protein
LRFWGSGAKQTRKVWRLNEMKATSNSNKVRASETLQQTLEAIVMNEKFKSKVVKRGKVGGVRGLVEKSCVATRSYTNEWPDDGTMKVKCCRQTEQMTATFEQGRTILRNGVIQTK